METQEKGQYGTNAKKTDNSKSSKVGILKEQSGDESITDISENKEVLLREKIPNTPIEVVGNDELGYWIGITNFRLTAPVKTEEEAMDRAVSTDWEAILNLYGALKMMEEMAKQEAENKAKTLENKIQEAQ